MILLVVLAFDVFIVSQCAEYMAQVWAKIEAVKVPRDCPP